MKHSGWAIFWFACALVWTAAAMMDWQHGRANQNGAVTNGLICLVMARLEV
jgi:hypothetical protein